VWCHQESNRGHKDFQSFALPTELWHHCRFAVGKGNTYFLIPQTKNLFSFSKNLSGRLQVI
jgi:hypothetical protein